VFREILTAYDGSPAARRALEHAVDLAAALNARLTIISVVAEMPGFAYRAPVSIEALEQEAQGESEQFLRDAVAAVPDDLPVTTVLKQGNAGERIVEQLTAGGHDLLVMGSRGRGRIASNLFGSTAAHVHFHRDHVPILVVYAEGQV
jgi:nucleotide-binding universal stress UspA family protein